MGGCLVTGIPTITLIKRSMKETDFSTILDRDEPKELVAKYFNNHMELLKELSNYGARLIVRIFSISERKQKDIIIIAVLFKQFVSMIDAIQIALQEGNVYAANLPLRTLYENQLYLQWILKDETIRRASQYYVWHLRRKLKINLSSIEGTAENIEFNRKLTGTHLENILDNVTSIQPEITKQNYEINKMLQSAEYTDINLEFDRLKGTRRNDVYWYQPWGPNSISDLVERLQRGAEYVIFYSSLSNITHSQSIDQMISYKDDKVIFENIRNLESIDTVISITSSYCYRTFRLILEKYSPSEVENLSRKYAEEWRDRSMNIPKVKYEDGEFILF